MEEVDLRLGNCLEVLKSLPSQSIDLTVTSPPYDNLRTYNGYSFDFEGIAKELYRITKDGGVVVWVVGDATINGSETGTSFKQALYFKEIGFNLHDTMIYQKSSQPKQHGHRYEQHFEYMFVLSKNKPKTKNLLKEPSKNAGKIVNRTSRDHDSDILMQSKSIVSQMKYKGNVWFYGSKLNDTNHPAIFPEQLAHDHIVSWSNEGDTVLDCFLGSGTTGKVAKQLNRRFVGIEISPEYLEIAKKRIHG